MGHVDSVGDWLSSTDSQSNHDRSSVIITYEKTIHGFTSICRPIKAHWRRQSHPLLPVTLRKNGLAPYLALSVDVIGFSLEILITCLIALSQQVVSLTNRILGRVDQDIEHLACSLTVGFR